MSKSATDDAAIPTQQSLLNQLTISTPCDVAWDGMAGSDRERHCESCAKTVHNLIELSSGEAYRIVTEAAAKVCVRIHRDAAGNVVTKDTFSPLSPTRRGFFLRWATLAASCLGLSSLIGCKRLLHQLFPAVQGDVCPPPNAGTTPSGSGNHAVVHGCVVRPPQPKSSSLPPLPNPLPAAPPNTAASKSSSTE